MQERLAGQGHEVKLGNEVLYIDPTNLSQFIIMPDWFKEITTIPGVPFGFLAEFVGPPNSGKTTAGMVALISAQKTNNIAILVDAERKFNHTRFQEMGGDPETLIVIAKPSIEENFDALENSIRTYHELAPGVGMLVLYDSIAVGATQSELAKKATDPYAGMEQPKVIKRMIRRTLGIIPDSKCAFIAINQMYSGQGNHGHPVYSGGKGMEYGKALSVRFDRVGDLPTKTVSGVAYKKGIITRVQSPKNHLLSGDMVAKEVLLQVTAYDMVKYSKGKKKGAEEAEEFDELTLDD